MKKIQKTLLLFAVIMAVFVSCTMSVSAAVNPTVTVSTTERNLLVGKYLNLEAKASWGATLKFKSGNTNIVAVNSNGTIKGKKNGAAWVYVWATKGTARSAVKKVLVVVGKSQPISIKKNSVGVTGKVNAGASSVGKRTYKSSNTGIFTVDAYGNITGKKAGTATLTVTAARGKSGGYFYVKTSKAFKITVLRNGQTISVPNSTISNKPGTKINLGASSKTQRSYGSSNSNVCAVDRYGNLTFKNPGSAVISIWAAGTNVYKSASAKVTVNVTGFDQTVNVSQTAYTLTMGENASISASAQTPVTYSSSDTSIVTVDAAGNIYAKERQEEGNKKVTITVTAAKTEKYASAKAAVTVTVQPNGRFEQQLVSGEWTETLPIQLLNKKYPDRICPEPYDISYLMCADAGYSINVGDTTINVEGTVESIGEKVICQCWEWFDTADDYVAHVESFERAWEEEHCIVIGYYPDGNEIFKLSDESIALGLTWDDCDAASDGHHCSSIYPVYKVTHWAKYNKVWVLDDGSGIVSSTAAIAGGSDMTAVAGMGSPEAVVIDEANIPEMAVTDSFSDVLIPDETAVPDMAVSEEEVVPDIVISEEVVPDMVISEENVTPDAAVSEENIVPDTTVSEEVVPEVIISEENVVPEAAVSEEAPASDEIILDEVN